MTIKTGDMLPDASFTTMTSEGPSKLSTADVFGGRKVVLFAVPGAFTPTCHMKHLPGFIAPRRRTQGQGRRYHRLRLGERRFQWTLLGQNTGGPATRSSLPRRRQWRFCPRHRPGDLRCLGPAHGHPLKALCDDRRQWQGHRPQYRAGPRTGGNLNRASTSLSTSSDQASSPSSGWRRRRFFMKGAMADARQFVGALVSGGRRGP